jgi:hypothetical protein
MLRNMMDDNSALKGRRWEMGGKARSRTNDCISYTDGRRQLFVIFVLGLG